MATNNQVNVGLSGSTGTGTFVGVTSPVMVTPVLGVASATKATFSSTSGIIGTTTNNNANALSVGEYVSSSVLVGAPVSLTSTTPANVTSISLTAGDWDVRGTVAFAFAGTTTSTVQRIGISSTSATYGTNAAENNGAQFAQTLTGAATMVVNTGSMRFSLAGTTTVYLIASATFATSTATAYGFIGARRVR